MVERPVLDKELDSETFSEFYYLKEELVVFVEIMHYLFLEVK
ncbi:MAG: hypothetical protein QM571_03980 [Micrococcaceae bacterium]